jgi:3-mercaptopyruvate sulfurtransferase SseA
MSIKSQISTLVSTEWLAHNISKTVVVDATWHMPNASLPRPRGITGTYLSLTKNTNQPT